MLKKMLCVLLSSMILVMPLAAQSRTTIAVLELKGSGMSAAEAEVLTNRLRSNLVNLGLYDVVDRGHMDTILNEQGFQQSECTSTECAVEVGQLLGVQKMISGSVGKFGKIWTMDLNLLDVETSGIDRTATYDYYGEIENLLLEGVRVALYSLLEIEESPEPSPVVVQTQPEPEPERPAVQPQPRQETPPEEQSTEESIVPQPEEQEEVVAQAPEPEGEPDTAPQQQAEEKPTTPQPQISKTQQKPDIHVEPMTSKKKGKAWLWLVVAAVAGGAGAYFATQSGGEETTSLPDASSIWPPR